jgi:alkylation response protein AidB-like acyl-CoA dehydrogenase
MDLSFSTEQLQIQNLARELAQKELAPKAAEIDRTAAFPRDSLKKLTEAGLMGMGVPPDFGGSKSDTVSYLLAVEELAKACASTTIILTAHVEASSAIVAGGSDDTKKLYLSSLASGEKLGAFAATEPGCGSNVFNVEMSARADGDHYLVNGTKAFITNGEEAHVHVTVVRTNPEQLGPMGQSMLLIEKGSPGFSFGAKYERMGFRGTSSQELILEDCRVPKANLLGLEGGYMMIMGAISGGMMLGAAATSLGIAQIALEASIKYAKERLQPAQPLTAYQTVKLMLVDMSTAVDAARAMVYQAAVALDSAAPGPPLNCFKAKLFTTEMAVDVTNKALQIHGGTGYCCALPIERYYRDARGVTIHAQPTEALKDFTAMFLLA